ncbi:MAG: hypothetical protein RLZZ415_1812 [Pseudomonadota bacterium]|jgi:hypothetical protein
MNLFKALFPGTLLTWLVSSAIGSQGHKGAWLMIEKLHIDQHTVYWSWPLFVITTALAWIILTLIPR